MPWHLKSLIPPPFSFVTSFLSDSLSVAFFDLVKQSILGRGLHSRMPFPGNQIFPKKNGKSIVSGIREVPLHGIGSVPPYCHGLANSGSALQSCLVLSRSKRAREHRPLILGIQSNQFSYKNFGWTQITFRQSFVRIGVSNLTANVFLPSEITSHFIFTALTNVEFKAQQNQDF